MSDSTTDLDPLITTPTTAPAVAKRKRAASKKTSAEAVVVTEPAKVAPKRKRAVKASEAVPVEPNEPATPKKATRARKPKAAITEEPQLVQPELIAEEPPKIEAETSTQVFEEEKTQESPSIPPSVPEQPSAQPPPPSPYQRQERSHHPNVITVSNYPPYQPGVTKVQTKSHAPREHRERRENREQQPTPNQDATPQQPVNPDVQVGPTEPVYAEGLVEVSNKGFGFLREPKRNYVQSPLDIFVTPEVIRRYLLRDGQWIKGEIRRGSRGPQLFKLTEINGEDPEKYTDITAFEELTTINPDQRIKLETDPDRYTTPSAMC